MHFTYFPGPARIVLTPIGRGEGRDEPLSRFLDGVDPADLSALLAVLQGNGVQTLTFRRCAPDRTFTLFAQALSDAPAGQAITAGVILERGTELAGGPEAAMSESFMQAANDLPHTIFMLDFDTHKHFWSDAFQERFGHPPIHGPDAVAKWLDLVHPEDLPRIQGSHGAARSGGADTWQGEYRLRRADGSYATVIDRATFFRRADGSISRSISSLEEPGVKPDEPAQRHQGLAEVLEAIVLHGSRLELDPDLGQEHRVQLSQILAAARRGLGLLTPKP